VNNVVMIPTRAAANEIVSMGVLLRRQCGE
jgi:hypothetical protein